MIRFLICKKWRDQWSGAEGVDYYTIDCDMHEKVEAALSSGGMGEGCYEIHSLVGVEIVRTKEPQ